MFIYNLLKYISTIKYASIHILPNDPIGRRGRGGGGNRTSPSGS